MKIIFPTRGTKLRYPFGSVIQGWSENFALYHAVNPNLNGHPGIDIIPTTGYGEDILSPHDGVIAKIAYIENGYGNEIAILSPRYPDGHYICSFLCHLTPEILVTEGQTVKEGDVVAKMGNSGFVVSGGVPYWGQANPDHKGTHCHWKTLWLTDATDHSNTSFLGKDYLIRDYGNGFDSSFDPLTLLGETMTNSYLIQVNKKDGTKEFAVALPATTEDALIDKCLNTDIPLPTLENGKKVDWANVQPKFTINE